MESSPRRVSQSQLSQVSRLIRRGCFPGGKGGEREPPVIPIKRPPATAPKRQTSPPRPPPCPPAMPPTPPETDTEPEFAEVDPTGRYGRVMPPFPTILPASARFGPLIPRPSPLPCSRIPHSCSTRRFLARAPSRRCILSFPPPPGGVSRLGPIRGRLTWRDRLKIPFLRGPCHGRGIVP